MATLEKQLTSSIKNLECAITDLQDIENPTSSVRKYEKELRSIQNNLLKMRNGLMFDRKTELKALLDNVLKEEGFGYETALICFAEVDFNSLQARQFDNGFYELSNGERISKDFRMILYLYINS